MIDLKASCGSLIIILATLVECNADSICPPNTFQRENYCIPITIDSCPPNSTYRDGYCQVNSAITTTTVDSCSSPYTYSGGVCLNKQLIENCPSNPQNCIVSNRCASETCDRVVQMECGANMINYNGGCAPLTVAQCPRNTVLNNGLCNREDTCVENCDTVCPLNSILVGNACQRSMPCDSNLVDVNGICGSCAYNYVPYNGQCIENAIPSSVTIYQSPAPAKVITIEKKEPQNLLNVIDITNIVNSSNTVNVITNINASNINNINLKSLTTSFNSNGGDIVDEEAASTSDLTDFSSQTCCIIVEPRTCVPFENKIKCYHKRHHKCGEECENLEIYAKVDISYQDHIPNYTDQTPGEPLYPSVQPYPHPYPTAYPTGQYPGMSPYPGGSNYPVPSAFPGIYPSFPTHPGSHELGSGCNWRQDGGRNWICDQHTASPRCFPQAQWPFMNCAQNVKIGCNGCDQMQCHPMCY